MKKGAEPHYCNNLHTIIILRLLISLDIDLYNQRSSHTDVSCKHNNVIHKNFVM